MVISRRTFLRIGTTSGFIAAIPIFGSGTALTCRRASAGTLENKPVDPVSEYQIRPESQRRSFDTLTQAIFSQQLHTSFQLTQQHPAGTISIILTEVIDFKARSPDEGTKTLIDESFSLIFQTPDAIEAGQDVYILEHPSLGTFEIFLVPLAAKEKSLEAVINRLHT